MKLIKEHINEKFTEDSDPIADMNIGMMNQIKLWMESINDSFYDKDYALGISAENGKLDFVEYLLADDAYVHANNDYALRWASENGHTEVVKVLLTAGANVHARNNYALRWANFNEHTEVVKVLKDHIAKERNVKESVNEKFTEDSDPINDIGIGKKHYIEKWIEYYNIVNKIDRHCNFKDLCVINSDLTIDVRGSVSLNSCGLYKLPSYIKFNKIYGDFMINHNNLKDMIGCPNEVTGNFYVNGNPLKSLKGCPKEIGSSFAISQACGFSENEIMKKSGCKQVLFTEESIQKVYFSSREDYNIDRRIGEIKDYVFEKFTEDSDPIHDMNIGIKRYLHRYYSNKISGVAWWTYKNIKFFLNISDNNANRELLAYNPKGSGSLKIRRTLLSSNVEGKDVEELWRNAEQLIIKYIIKYIIKNEH